MNIGPLLIGDRPMPQSLQAERAVLSCCLQSPEGCVDDTLARLQEDAFFAPAHRRLFAVLRDLRAEGPADRIDVLAVQDRLERQGLLDAVGGEAYISQVFGTAPTTANLEHYLEGVQDTYILRRLIEAGAQTVARCFDAGDDLDSVIDGIERDVLDATALRIVDKAYSPLKDLLRGALDHLEAVANRDPAAIGLPTGFPDVDHLISGLKPGDMIVLAARPSIGKTTFALNIADHVARQGHAVGVFSLEMGGPQLALRLLCAAAKFSLVDVRDGRMTSATLAGPISRAWGVLSKLPIYIDDTPQITALELRQKARRMKVDHDVKFLMIDYLQLMRPTGGNKNSNREQDVARLSNDIKALAKELGIPIMILAQLNRQAELGGKPKLAHLRESGAIEQDADVVVLLHREREAAMVGSQEGDSAPSGAVDADVIVAKNRNGPTGDAKLWFFPAWTRFESQSRVADQDMPSPRQGGHVSGPATGYKRDRVAGEF